MKKTIGFIFALILVVLFANVASVKAETYLIGVKDYYKEQPKKNKSKKVKKSKKASKKGRKVKKNNIGTVEVISASSYFTNNIDLSKIDYQKSLLSIIRQKDGYLGIPDFLDKFNTAPDEARITVMADKKATALVEYWLKEVRFGLIDSSNFSYIKLYGASLSDRDTLIKRLSNIGIKLSFSHRLLSDMLENEKSYPIKVGNANWVLRADSYGIILERVITPIKITERNVFKAVTFDRLNLTSTFYEKFLTLVNKTNILSDDSEFGIGFGLEFGEIDMDKYINSGLVNRLIYADLRDYGRTEIRIAGDVNPDKAVEELAGVLKDYCDIDFYEFDTSRVNKIVVDGIVNWDYVVYTKDYGKNNLEIRARYDREKGIGYVIKVTVHND